MGPKSKQKASPPPAAPTYKTIGEKLQGEYLASRPFQALFEAKGYEKLSATEKTAYANAILLEDGAYKKWTDSQQNDFLKLCEQQKIPFPLPKPADLGTDRKGRRLADYTLEEHEKWETEQLELLKLNWESQAFREKFRSEKKKFDPKFDRRRGRAPLTEEAPDATKVAKNIRSVAVTPEEIEEEKTRRIKISEMERSKKPGRYGGDPEWDDVVPIPQDDGEKPLAAIAYTDEYAEAISYLRAVMAANEHSPRVLNLTAHIITLNPAHYTVWLYRASTLFALSSDLTTELKWVNEIALANQKNYQIWHHRQLLLDNLFPTLTPANTHALASDEIAFLTSMFDRDAKNYHVWSYRQYLVRKLSLFPSQSSEPNELHSVEEMLISDVRNNSAWSHRFFIVFSDPAHSTPGSAATARDEKIPEAILDREIEFTEAAIWRAPQNPSAWNYLRGVLRKGGRDLSSVEAFAEGFVKWGAAGEQEDVKSSHALDLLADCWIEKGEKEMAGKALTLLGDKYDPIRKNYWEWRRSMLYEVKG